MKKQLHKIVWISGLILLTATSAMAQPTPIPNAVQQSTGLNGAVTALTVYDGKLIIAGRFTLADGIPCNGLVTYNGTSFDTLPGTPAFGTTSGNNIYALLQYGNSLYVGGDFQTLTTSSGTVRFGHIVRYNGAGQWLQMGTNTTHPVFAATNGPVRSLHNYDGELFIGGDFTSVDINGNDISAGHIATYDINVQGWDSVGLGSMGLTGISATTVQAMTTFKQLPTSNAQLVIAGRFKKADNTTSRNAVIWDNILGYISINTGNFTSQVGRVNCVDTLDGKLYVGGDFNNIGLNNYFGLNAYDGSTWTNLNANIGIDRRALFSCNEGYIWMGGNLVDLGANVKNLFVYDVANDSVLPFSSNYWGVDGIVNSMVEYNGELYIAGEFENLLGGNGQADIAYKNIFKVSNFCSSVATGINDVQAENEIRFYPNPANNFVTITNILIGSKLKVIDITGKLVYNSIIESEQTTISTVGIVNGVYIIQVENNGEVVNRKLVVNKQ